MNCPENHPHPTLGLGVLGVNISKGREGGTDGGRGREGGREAGREGGIGREGGMEPERKRITS